MILEYSQSFSIVLNQIIVYQSLVSSLRSKYLHSMVKSFKLPDKCTLTATRSEKAFVGEYPFGSSLSLVETNFVIGTELIYVENGFDFDSVVCVNLYSSVDESKDATFKFFVLHQHKLHKTKKSKIIRLIQKMFYFQLK